MQDERENAHKSIQRAFFFESGGEVNDIQKLDDRKTREGSLFKYPEVQHGTRRQQRRLKVQRMCARNVENSKQETHVR